MQLSFWLIGLPAALANASLDSPRPVLADENALR
jgi:hypothetical protein